MSQEPLSGSGLPMTPLPTLDLSLHKKPDPSVLEQFVSPGALVPESSVLKVGKIFCLPKIMNNKFALLWGEAQLCLP